MKRSLFFILVVLAAAPMAAQEAPEALNKAGLRQDSLGNKEEARTFFRKAWDAGSSNPIQHNTQRGKAALLLAYSYIQSDSIPQAMGWLTSGIAALASSAELKEKVSLNTAFELYNTLNKKLVEQNLLLTPFRESELQTAEVAFPIATSTGKSSGVRTVVILFGTNDGLYLGATGRSMAPYVKDQRETLIDNTGAARIVAITPNTATLEIRTTAAAKDQPKKGDFVVLNTRVPKGVYNGLFREHILAGIDFQTLNRTAFVPFRLLLLHHTEALENAALDSMRRDLANTYEMIREDSTNPSYTEPTRGGRFDGKNLFYALTQATNPDLRSFFWFVKSFPGKYIGNHYKVNETFATWVINNSPTSAFEVAWYLEGATDGATYAGLANGYKRLLDTTEFFAEWNVQAQREASRGDTAAAERWMRIIDRYASHAGTPALRGQALFTKAYLAAEKSSEDPAQETHLLGAIDAFAAANIVEDRSLSVNNLANYYYQLRDYPKAMVRYAEAAALKRKLFTSDSTPYARRNLYHSLIGGAQSHNKLSNYREALRLSAEALKVLGNGETLMLQQKRAEAYRELGKNHQALADWDKAAAYYAKEYELQKKLGDKEAQADALDNVAFLKSKLAQYRAAIADYRRAYNLHVAADEPDDAGYSLSSIAQSLWSLGQFDSAITHHHDAIALRSRGPKPTNAAYSWRKLGTLYSKSGNVAKSDSAFATALRLYRQGADTDGEASTGEEKGDALYTLKNYSAALTFYEASLRVHQSLGSKTDIARLLASKASVYFDQNLFRAADSFYTEAATIREAIGDRDGYVSSLLNQAIIQRFFYNNLQTSRTMTVKALGLATEIGSTSNEAFALLALGRVDMALANYPAALRAFRRGTAIYTKLDDKENIARGLLQIGGYYSGQLRYDSARYYYEKSNAVADASKNKTLRQDGDRALADMATQRGDFAGARRIYTRILTGALAEGNPWGVGGGHQSLGDLANSIGDYNAAVMHYRSADSVYTLIGLADAANSADTRIGTIYYYQGDYAKALEMFQSVLKRLEQKGEDKAFLSLIKGNIGEVHLEMRNHTDAAKWLGEAAALATETGATDRIISIKMLQGKLLTRTGRWQEALKLLGEVEAIAVKNNIRTALPELYEYQGRAYIGLNKPAEAKKTLSAAVSIAAETGVDTYKWKAQALLAELEEAAGRTEAAAAAMKEAIITVERIKERLSGGEEARKVFASGESVLDLYEKMIIYLKKLGRTDEVLGYMERAATENLRLRLKGSGIRFADEKLNKALGLESEYVAKVTAIEKQILTEKLKPEAEQNKAQLARLEGQKSVAENEYQGFVGSLVKQYPQLTNHFKKNINPVDFKKEKKYIPEDVAILLYLAGEKSLYIFAAVKDSVFAREIPIGEKELNAKVQEYYRMAAWNRGKAIRGGAEDAATTPAPDSAVFGRLSDELYDLLVAPVQAQIAAKPRIAIVPNGGLCFLPFQSLTYTSAAGQKRYWVDDKSIFYVNKIVTVTGNREAPLGAMRIAAVGNADLTLPNAEAEVAGLKKAFPNTKVFIGKAATRKAVLATTGTSNVLHLATHGILNYSHFDSSYLVLAGDGAGDDGRLRINDIYGIEGIDNYGMVTLSACETAVTKELVEGWPVTTASAFIDAGVPSVIASLWQVDDEATSILMSSFYNNLRTMSKVDALRQAQIQLQRIPKYKHPYYWAPFLLVGVWK